MRYTQERPHHLCDIKKSETRSGKKSMTVVFTRSRFMFKGFVADYRQPTVLSVLCCGYV